jgi:S1-C subfamily serine protease
VPAGAGVVKTVGSSPAEAAGIRAGDRIRAVNGVPVTSARDLERLVRAIRENSREDRIELDIFRPGEGLKPIAFALPEPGTSARRDHRMGIYVGDAEPLVRADSLVPNSVAERLGVAPGEALYSVNGVPVKTLRDLYALMKRFREDLSRSTLVLEVGRPQGPRRRVEIALP